LTLAPALRLAVNTDVWLVTTWQTAARLALLFLIFLVPFALAGFVIASTVAAGSGRIATLYFFDLLGGSLGCLVFVPLMGTLGGPNTVLAAGALWTLAALLWAIGAGSRRLALGSAAACLCMLAVIALNHAGGMLSVRYMRGNPVEREEFARWNVFSRVSVLEDESGRRWIMIDGGAGTQLSKGEIGSPGEDAAADRVASTGPDLGFWLQHPKRALVIGAGGGVDVARAVASGAHETVAVEINPLIADDIMRNRYLDYSHGLYERPDVRIVVEDGRSFVRRPGRPFDVIQLSQVDTWASTASGGYTLTESYLYTVEAFEDYLARLSNDGLLSVSRWEFRRPRESLRVVAVALKALERRGTKNPERHIVVVLENVHDRKGIMRMGTVLVSRSPLSREKIASVVRKADDLGLEVAYASGTDRRNPIFTELIESSDRRSFFDSYPFDVEPVFDNSPFFFFSGRWRNTFRDLFVFDPSGDSVNTGAQFLLVVALALAVLGMVVFLLGPLVLFRRAFPAWATALPYLAFCLAVGIAYMMVELSLIHAFVVFLGQPVYSLTVVILTFLLSSSLGSRLSELLTPRRLVAGARAALAGIVCLLVVYVWLLPILMRTWQSADSPLKAAVVALTIFPLGFLMGIPFPSALRLAAATGEHVIEWAWAVNAAATVLGSVAAIFIFVATGIKAGLAVGAVAYVGCTLLLSGMNPEKGRRLVGRPGQV